MPILESYGQAYRTDVGAPETVHIQKNGDDMALCGRGPVRFIGEVEAPDTEGWKRCGQCWRIAGPDTTSIWEASEI